MSTHIAAYDSCTIKINMSLLTSSILQPKNYLDFITSYKRSLGSQRKEISETSDRLSNGLAKLVQASAEVDVLQKELSQAKVVVEAATQECDQLLQVGCWYCQHSKR